MINQCKRMGIRSMANSSMQSCHYRDNTVYPF